jgi:ABC-type antimicrobial peptide transport system permease subunit
VSFFGYELVVRTSGDASRFVEPVRRVIQATAATVPYAKVRAMDDMLGSRMRAWDLGAKVFTAFGVLALVLAAVGLYSVLAFSIAQRMHEFGVRVALGAQAADVIRLTLSAGLTPVFAGIGAGVVLALLGGKYVSSLLFGVAPRDPAVLGTVCAVLLGTGVLASVVPAMRATRVDPAAVLRSD